MKYIIVVMIALIAVAGCSQAPVEQEELVIGGLFCQTGFAAFAGESSRDGFLLAIADAKTRGVDVEYVTEDCESDFTKTRTAAMKLTAVDGIDVIIGPEWEMSAVVAPMAAEGEVLFVSPWLTIDPEWTETELFMSAMPREQSYTDSFSAWMVKEGIKSVAFVGSIDDFAMTVEKTARVAFARDGIKFVGEITTEGDGDFRTEIIRLKEMDADAVFVVFAMDSDEAQFVRQAKELGLEKQILTHYARAESGAFLDACGDACEGTVFASPRAPARSAEFAVKFSAHFGRDPIAPSAATAYDATTAVIAAFEAGAATPQEVHGFLEEATFDGFAIKEWDDGFVAGGDAVIKQIVDGERIVIA